MVRKPILLAVMLAFTSSLFAQQSWEGLATVSRFGRFPAGLYGASNLVSPNTLVTVRNLETGNSERIIITGGIDEPGVFLVLSPEAATLLNVTASGATRVRLTTIVTDRPPMDSAAEQALHPDPDINPAASVSGMEEPADLLPLIAEAPESVAVEAAASTGPGETESKPKEPGQAEATGQTAGDEQTVQEPQPSEPAQTAEATPAEPLATEATPEPEAGAAESTTVESASVGSEPASGTAAVPERRGGIAAGIARTRVGQAQESFERPETPLEVERPETVAPIEQPVGEPEVAPEEEASPALAALEPAPEEMPRDVVAPEPPAEETAAGPEAATVVAAATGPDETGTVAVETAEAASASEPAANPINDAVAAAMNRIPSRDYFPAPVGEEGDLGFSSLRTPTGSTSPEVALLEAVAPPVDRPELAGLGPLQAAPSPLPDTLAEASVPPEDLPEYADLGAPKPLASGLGSPQLAVATPAEEERPVVEDFSVPTAPGVALTPGELAEAAVAPEERPELSDITPAAPPGEQPLDATLAEAPVAAEERPELADLGSVSAPAGLPFDAELAEAPVAEEERPDLADLGSAAVPPEAEVSGDLAEAVPGDVERPQVADLGTVTAPGELPLEAELAEAPVAAEERPDLADLGTTEAPALTEVAGELAEAEPEAVERPEESLAGATPWEAADVPATTMEPEPAEAATEMVEGPIEGPAETPKDVLLTLEPADFRPPEVPGPDEESIIDREEPAEPPAMVAELETPETQPEEAAQPEVVEQPAETSVAVATEPVSPATSAPPRDTALRGLPVVADLADNNYYLQIGAYTVPATAQVAVDALSATYPMAVMPIESRGQTVYRVLVGPLEQDETGTLLLFLRAKGYRDTFIRSGAEL